MFEFIRVLYASIRISIVSGNNQAVYMYKSQLSRFLLPLWTWRTGGVAIKYKVNCTTCKYNYISVVYNYNQIWLSWKFEILGKEASLFSPCDSEIRPSTACMSMKIILGNLLPGWKIDLSFFSLKIFTAVLFNGVLMPCEIWFQIYW